MYQRHRRYTGYLIKETGMIVMMISTPVLALAWFIVSVCIPSMVLAQQFSSSEEQVPLIELYTSEGCSSCPPTDRWMSNLKLHDSFWSGFVPMALHVDNWDYIGWKDPFASREYS